MKFNTTAESSTRKSLPSDELDSIQAGVGIFLISLYGVGLILTAIAALFVEVKTVQNQKYRDSNVKKSQTITDNTNTTTNDHITSDIKFNNSDSSTPTGNVTTAVNIANENNDDDIELEYKHGYEPKPKDLISPNTDIKAEDIKINNVKGEKKLTFFGVIKQILKRIQNYKGIYFTAIIHFSDVITDLLILIQYILFAIDEKFYNHNYENIDYAWVAFAALIILIFNRILGCYFIWIFTKSFFDIFLNFIDFYIFKEIFASHESGNKTDLLQFLQKIEKIFESAPQFTLQTFVLLRSDASYGDIGAIGAQLLSIFLSLYAISDKLITDDSKMFIAKSGANESWKPHKLFIFRVLFRICEVTSNLFILVIIGVFYGAFWFCLYFGWLLFVNLILYINGLLGEEQVNILAYCVTIMNLGVCCQHDPPKFVATRQLQLMSTTEKEKETDAVGLYHELRLKDKLRMVCGKLFRFVISCLFIKIIDFSKHKYSRYLSYYYLSSRVIQGILTTVITGVLFGATMDIKWTCIVCTESSSRNAHPRVFATCLIVTFVCYIMQYIFYIQFFNAMHLGASLHRKTETLVGNHQFFDAIRLEKIQRRNSTDSKIDSVIDMFDKVFSIIINDNVTLLYISESIQSNTISNHEIKEYHYFIKQINLAVAKSKSKSNNGLALNVNVGDTQSQDINSNSNSSIDNSTRNDKMQQLLIETLTHAIITCHSTMIGFIICNQFINNIDKLKMGSDGLNILSFINEHCDHLIDEIIEPLITKYSPFIDNFDRLLEQDGRSFREGGERTKVMQKFFVNSPKYENIVKYLSKYHFNTFETCCVVSYIFESRFNLIVQYINFPKLGQVETENNGDINENNTNSDRAANVSRILWTHIAKHIRLDNSEKIKTLLTFFQRHNITVYDYFNAGEAINMQENKANEKKVNDYDGFVDKEICKIIGILLVAGDFEVYKEFIEYLPATDDNINNVMKNNTCESSLSGIILYEWMKMNGYKVTSIEKYIQLLLNKFEDSININVLIKENHFSMTILQYAIMNGLVNVVKMLMNINNDISNNDIRASIDPSDEINSINIELAFNENNKPQWYQQNVLEAYNLFELVRGSDIELMQFFQSKLPSTSKYKQKANINEKRKKSKKKFKKKSKKMKFVIPPLINVNNGDLNGIGNENENKNENDGSEMEKELQKQMEQELMDAIMVQDNPALFDILLDNWNNYCQEKNYIYAMINPFKFKYAAVINNRSNVWNNDYRINHLIGMITHKLLNDQRLGTLNDQNNALWFAIFEKWFLKFKYINSNSNSKQFKIGNLIRIATFGDILRLHLNANNYSFVFKLCCMKLYDFNQDIDIMIKDFSQDSKKQGQLAPMPNNAEIEPLEIRARKHFIGNVTYFVRRFIENVLENASMDDMLRLTLIDTFLDTWFGVSSRNGNLDNNINDINMVYLGYQPLNLLFHYPDTEIRTYPFWFIALLMELIGQYKNNFQLTWTLDLIQNMIRNPSPAHKHLKYINILIQNHKIFDINRIKNVSLFIKASMLENNVYLLKYIRQQIGITNNDVESVTKTFFAGRTYENQDYYIGFESIRSLKVLEFFINEFKSIPEMSMKSLQAFGNSYNQTYTGCISAIMKYLLSIDTSKNKEKSFNDYFNGLVDASNFRFDQQSQTSYYQQLFEILPFCPDLKRLNEIKKQLLSLNSKHLSKQDDTHAFLARLFNYAAMVIDPTAMYLQYDLDLPKVDTTVEAPVAAPLPGGGSHSIPVETGAVIKRNKITLRFGTILTEAEAKDIVDKSNIKSFDEIVFDDIADIILENKSNEKKEKYDSSHLESVWKNYAASHLNNDLYICARFGLLKQFDCLIKHKMPDNPQNDRDINSMLNLSSCLNGAIKSKQFEMIGYIFDFVSKHSQDDISLTVDMDCLKWMIVSYDVKDIEIIILIMTQTKPAIGFEPLARLYGRFDLIEVSKDIDVLNVNKSVAVSTVSVDYENKNAILDDHDFEAKDQGKNENKNDVNDDDVNQKRNELFQHKSHNEHEWGVKHYTIAMNQIENSLLNLHQRYVASVNGDRIITAVIDEIDTNKNDNKLKFDIIDVNDSNIDVRKEIESFLFNNIICNNLYFCSNSFKYNIESAIIGTIASETTGIYLFHAILKNDLMSLTLMNIINKYQDNMKTLLLLLDGRKQLPIQCIVFGSYNEKYQNIKDLKDDANNEKIPLVKLLHKIAKQSIKIKMKNII